MKKVSFEGQFVTSFGGMGKRPGEFNCPHGLAVGMGKRPGEFNCPYGLAVDNSGVVYVCDSSNALILT